MMWLFNQASTAARTSLVYITVGAMTVIWTGVWYVYLYNNPPETHSVYYWCTGFLVSGLTLVLIGLGLGRIGRSAPGTDLRPVVVPPGLVSSQPNGVGHGFVQTVAKPAAPIVVLDLAQNEAQTAGAVAHPQSGS
jgi:hypothetical protein